MLIRKGLGHKKYHKYKILHSSGLRAKTILISDNLILKAGESGRISEAQLEASRKVAKKVLKRGGKLWLLTPPAKPITAKPLEVRMGKGKGAVAYKAVSIRAGADILGLISTSSQQAKRAIALAQKKLAIGGNMVVFAKPKIGPYKISRI